MTSKKGSRRSKARAPAKRVGAGQKKQAPRTKGKAKPGVESSAEVARAYLHAHGLHLSSRSLDRMLRHAVQELRCTLYPDSSSDDLTESEIKVLAEGGFDLVSRQLGEQDPLARTTAEFAAVLETSKTVAEVARLLQVNTSRIRQRLGSDSPSIYGFKVGAEWRIPSFQFDGERLLPGIESLPWAHLAGLQPVAIYRWFTSPSPDLVVEEVGPVSPRDWLRLGQPPGALAELAERL